MVLTLLLLFGMSATAALTPKSFKDVVAFGDSMSDNGNLFREYAIPGPPYWQGHFTNGKNWIEYLAGYLSNANLHDYAYGGAVSNISNAFDITINAGLKGPSVKASKIPDVFQQFNIYLRDKEISSLSADTTLFSVFIGGNDLSFSAESGAIPNPVTIAGNSITVADMILSRGGKHILISNMPPLQDTPLISNDPNMKPFVAFVGLIVQGYNLALAKGLSQLRTKFPHANIILNDFNNVTSYMRTPAGSKYYNLTEVYHTCINTTFICKNPENYFFWDYIHPTTTSQNFLAQHAFNQIFNLPGYVIQTIKKSAKFVTKSCTR